MSSPFGVRAVRGVGAEERAVEEGEVEAPAVAEEEEELQPGVGRLRWMRMMVWWQGEIDSR